MLLVFEKENQERKNMFLRNKSAVISDIPE
jgi:hypothetical protein